MPKSILKESTLKPEEIKDMSLDRMEAKFKRRIKGQVNK